MWNNSASTGRIFVKFDNRVFFSKTCPESSTFIKNEARTTGTHHRDLRTFMIICRSFPLIMRNFFVKSCTENQNTHFTLSNVFTKIVAFMTECGKIRYIQAGHHMTAKHGAHAPCWIRNVTDTNSEYVILRTSRR